MFCKMIIAAAALASATGASANTAGVYLDVADKAHVRYSDLDLQSALGRAQLRDRIRHAADLVCTFVSGFTAYDDTRSDCMRVAIASGNSQMDAVVSR
jgi:UrcA family protein